MSSSKVVLLKLDKLNFDPNNYRLRSHKNYNFVEPGNLLLKSVQKKTQNLISGSNNSYIRDLVESIKSNGYLKVDNILVRQIKNDSYIVVEGNRRLAALKFLAEEYEKGNEIGKLSPSVFSEPLETILYDYDNEKDYLILMGLKHVSGNKKWERYNQAKLLYELRKELKLTEGEIAAKIGITKTQVQKEIRGYLGTEHLVQEVKDEGFDDYNPYEKIMLMIQLTDKPKLRDWIGWNDEKETFTNKKNKKRFFSWIKPTMQFDEETEQYAQLDPIINSHKEIRELEEIIDDDEALEIMEEQRNFKFALEQNASYTKKQFSLTIKKIETILKNIKTGTSLKMSRNDGEVLDNIILICQKLLKK